MNQVRIAASVLAMSLAMAATAEAQRARSDTASAALPDVEIPHETFTLGNGLRVVVSTDRARP